MTFTTIIHEAAQLLKSADKLKNVEFPELFDAMRIALDDWKHPTRIAREVEDLAEIISGVAEILNERA